jgi:hypothetical protein
LRLPTYIASVCSERRLGNVCVGYSCCCVEKFSLVRRGVLFRVAGEVSDLSRGTRLLLFGSWCGSGESGVLCLVLLGFY